MHNIHNECYNVQASIYFTCLYIHCVYNHYISVCDCNVWQCPSLFTAVLQGCFTMLRNTRLNKPAHVTSTVPHSRGVYKLTSPCRSSNNITSNQQLPFAGTGGCVHRPNTRRSFHLAVTACRALGGISAWL